MNTKANEIATTAAQDEALINDLFDQIGAGDELELDITQAQEPMAQEAVADEVEISSTPPTVEPTLEADLNDLNVDDLDLALQEPVVEVKAKTKKAKKGASTPKATETTEAKPEETVEKVEVKADEPKTTQQRVTHYNSKKSEVLLDRLGGNQDMILLEASDIDLDSNLLKEKQENLLRILNNQPTIMGTRGNGETVQKKVAEKVIILFTYFKNGGTLNKVMRIAFETILKDGHITTGKDGNLYNNLKNAHYSEGTARAQAGQMLQMFPLLKIASKEGNKLIPNEQSLILAKMKAELTPKM